MKTLITALVIALTASLGLAQTFTDDLAAYEANPTKAAARAVAYSTETVDQANQFATAVEQNAPADSLAMHAMEAATAYSIVGEWQAGKDFLKSVDSWSHRTCWPVLYHMAVSEGLTEGNWTVASDLDRIRPSDAVWRFIDESTPAVWVDAYLRSAVNARPEEASTTIQQKTHEAAVKLEQSGAITSVQAAEYFDNLYKSIWFGYLSLDDQTTEDALLWEKQATTAKSLRDMLAE